MRLVGFQEDGTAFSAWSCEDKEHQGFWETSTPNNGLYAKSLRLPSMQDILKFWDLWGVLSIQQEK